METTTSPPPPPPPPPAPPATTTTITNHDHHLDHVIQPNGVLKRHKPRHHQHHQHNPIIVTYKECLKNHAASMGGHAVDGCGEFMPSPTSVPTDPTSLKCAACGCHRNFHRREPDEVSFFGNTTLQLEYQPHHRHHPPPPPPPPLPLTIAPPPPPPEITTSSPAESPSPPPISSSYYPSAPHMLLALSTPGGSGATGGAVVSVSAPPHHMENPNPNSKKRFRTKFTQDQKQKMHELAERVGWKMQKKDEDLILGFCNQIGVDKGVFKVWMHNNKMTLGNIRKDTVTSPIENRNGSSAGGIGMGIDFLSQRDNNISNNNNNQLFQHHHHQQQQHNNDSVSSGGGNVIGTNGSSSSS